MVELNLNMPTTGVAGLCAVVPTGSINAPVLVIFALPVPSGAISISPFDVDVILFPFTSKSPPSCGVVSSTTSFIETACTLAVVWYKLLPSVI